VRKDENKGRLHRIKINILSWNLFKWRTKADIILGVHDLLLCTLLNSMYSEYHSLHVFVRYDSSDITCFFLSVPWTKVGKVPTF
jgi:hypothetical protein